MSSAMGNHPAPDHSVGLLDKEMVTLVGNQLATNKTTTSTHWQSASPAPCWPQPGDHGVRRGKVRESGRLPSMQPRNHGCRHVGEAPRAKRSVLTVVLLPETAMSITWDASVHNQQSFGHGPLRTFTQIRLGPPASSHISRALIGGIPNIRVHASVAEPGAMEVVSVVVPHLAVWRMGFVSLSW